MIIARRIVFVIENDKIGDEAWHPLVTETLREYADYQEATKGCGYFPQCFKSSNGNKLTAYAGTYLEETQLDGFRDVEKVRELKAEQSCELNNLKVATTS